MELLLIISGIILLLMYRWGSLEEKEQKARELRNEYRKSQRKRKLYRRVR